jgi:hypothetical protein
MSHASTKPKILDDNTPLTRPLTKSRFKMALECPTKLHFTGKAEYANRKLDDPFLKALAKGGFQAGKLAQLHYGPGEEITERDYEKAFAHTRLCLAQESATVFEASIRHGNHFVKVDVLRKQGNSLALIEVKAKGWPPPRDLRTKTGTLAASSGFVPYLYDVAYQTWVTRRAFPDCLVTPYLCLLNKEARTTVDSLNQCFKIVKEGKSFAVQSKPGLSKSDLGGSILVDADVSEFVGLILSSEDIDDIRELRGGKPFDEWVEWLAARYLADEKIPPVLSEECKGCEYHISPTDYPGKRSGFDECWKDAGKAAPSDRARSFDLWGGVKGVISEKGIYFLDELVEEDVKPKKPARYEETNPQGGWTRHERRMLQIEHTRNPKPGPRFHPDLAKALEVPKPWHFIDFETAMVAIPFTKGRRPYEQIAFQFSHHVIGTDGTIAHRTQCLEVKPGQFPNFEFVRALKKAIGDEGTVFRYAAHENTVLNQIHDQLLDSDEKDKEELIAWIRTLAEPTSANAERFPDWKPKRLFLDMLKYVQWFFWHPAMGGSNSIKVALPAMLASSDFLKRKYSAPIYGRDREIKSLNLDSRAWVSLEKDGSVKDPYSMLGPIFPDLDLSREALDDAYGDGDDAELRDGGAAMMAYCRLQFSDLSDDQRTAIQSALLRYCELDTLAMVMLWEGWLNAK